MANRRINLMPGNVDPIIMACVVLHNFLTGKRDIPALYQRLNSDNILICMIIGQD